jgi:hypothetical protein
MTRLSFPSLLLVALIVNAGGCGKRGGGGGGIPPMTDADMPMQDGGMMMGPDTGTPGPGWTEPLCDPLADLSDLEASYTGARLRETLTEIARRRYPIAVAFVEVQEDMYLFQWYGGSPPPSFGMALEGFEVVAHEGSHIWDLTMIGGEWPYRLTETRVIRTRNLTNFARSEILELHVDRETDFYDEVYLEGASGRQGFNNLLDEYNAYVHSLASKYCTRDALSGGFSTSARDGILTMMYYVELYLKVARTNHPDDYAAIVGDPGHIEMILTVWDRAEFWLEVTADEPSLGINDDVIRSWTYDPENLMEIEMLRGR